MPRINISSLPPRAIALTVLSKLLYALADKSGASDEVTTYHKRILADTIADDDLHERNQISDSFSISDIPWLELLDLIANHIVRLRGICATNNFTRQEIRYMTAMACGLTGKEFGLITGFKSHYNLSWSVRHKLGLPEKTSNLRLILQSLSVNTIYESTEALAPK